MAPKLADAQNPRFTVDIDWALYDSDIRELVHKLRSWSGIMGINHIYGIPRGGLTLAVHLSHVLGIPYEHSKIGLNPKETLLVDDVSDTGKTLWHYRQFGFVIATLYIKPGTRLVPNFYVREYSRDTWINYPWES